MSGTDSGIRDTHMSDSERTPTSQRGQSQQAGSSTGPGTQAQGHVENEGPGDKRKRPADDEPARTKKRKVVVKKKNYVSPTDWHLARKDIPQDAVSTKAALEVHLRALWVLLHQNAVPPTISPADILKFNERFKSEEEVKTSVNSHLNQHTKEIVAAHVKVAHLRSALLELDNKPGTIAASIQRTGETWLLFMFRMVACSGLNRWAPDVASKDADSTYNLLHEHIALKTFEQISLSYGYNHLGVNLQILRNFPLLRKLYRNFVFSYMYDIARMEAKKPGSVAMASDMTNIYKRRQDLSENRIDMLRAEGFNSTVISMADECEAHSDDEAVEGHVYFYIRKKEARSAKATKLFRMLDNKHKAYQARKGARYLRSVRDRREPAGPVQPCRITANPKTVPLDWFDPTYWNETLSLEEKIAFCKDGVTIALPTIEHCSSWTEISKWKILSKTAFMKDYGDKVLEEYELPTPEEIKQYEENRAGGNDNADDDSEEAVAQELVVGVDESTEHV